MPNGTRLRRIHSSVTIVAPFLTDNVPDYTPRPSLPTAILRRPPDSSGLPLALTEPSGRLQTLVRGGPDHRRDAFADHRRQRRPGVDQTAQVGVGGCFIGKCAGFCAAPTASEIVSLAVAACYVVRFESPWGYQPSTPGDRHRRAFAFPVRRPGRIMPP